MPKDKLYRTIRVVNDEGAEGVIEDVQDESIVVRWDTGSTTVVHRDTIEPKGRGRRPGQGRMEPVPAKVIVIERRITEVIQKERARLNLSERELAKKVKMSRRTIQRLLADNGHFQRIETLEKLATALGISPAKFWEVSVEPAKAA